MLRRACHWNRQTIYGSGRTHRSVDALQLTKLISRYRSKLYLSFSSSGDPGVNRARTHAEAMWKRLSAPREELNLHFTLPTGQSFRWRKIGQEDYIGLIGERVVRCWCTFPFGMTPSNFFQHPVFLELSALSELKASIVHESDCEFCCS